MINISHIHPMLVHFPIVFLISAILIKLLVMARKGDLSQRTCLPLSAFMMLLAGIGTAVFAAVFGDIALDRALDAGFPAEPLEEHETLAFVTIGYFILLAAVQGYSLWKNISLNGVRGWLVILAGIAGIGILISTAFHGGILVYEIGVNIDVVKP